MKKILTVLLAALLCLTLFAACGAPAEPAAPASEAAPAPEAPAEEPAAEPAEAPADAALPETFVLGLDASFPPMG